MNAPDLTAAMRAEVERFGIHEDDALPASIRFSADAERVELIAERVRSRLAGAPVENLHKTPDEMVDDLEWSKYGAGQIAVALKDAATAVKSARRVFGRAHAVALRASAGKSSEQREADALLACEEEQFALDVVETAQDFAKQVARAIEQTGSMTQTQAGLVKAQMALAGTGREA